MHACNNSLVRKIGYLHGFYLRLMPDPSQHSRDLPGISPFLAGYWSIIVSSPSYVWGDNRTWWDLWTMAINHSGWSTLVNTGPPNKLMGSATVSAESEGSFVDSWAELQRMRGHESDVSGWGPSQYISGLEYMNQSDISSKTSGFSIYINIQYKYKWFNK